MPDTRELPDLDNIPAPGANPDADMAPWSCEVCGQPVPIGAAGRKPRVMLCEEHRKARARGGAGSTTTSTRAGSHHERIKTGMQALHGMVAFGVGMVSIPTGSPVWGRDREIITSNAENIAEQWAKYCDDNPRMRKAILSFLETAGALSLAASYAPVVVAISMNHKQATTQAQAPAPVQQMPQAPPTPFERPAPAPFVPPPFYPPATVPPGGGTPVFQPSVNGNGLPFATDIPE